MAVVVAQKTVTQSPISNPCRWVWLLHMLSVSVRYTWVYAAILRHQPSKHLSKNVFNQTICIIQTLQREAIRCDAMRSDGWAEPFFLALWHLFTIFADSKRISWALYIHCTDLILHMCVWCGRRIYSIIGEHKHLIRIFHIIMLIKRINQAEHALHRHNSSPCNCLLCDFIQCLRNHSFEWIVCARAGYIFMAIFLKSFRFFIFNLNFALESNAIICSMFNVQFSFLNKSVFKSFVSLCRCSFWS